MKRKQVWQYSCDFCKKKKLSASGISKHEKHCTMNPDRECRVCKMVADGRDADFVQLPLSSLIALLPDSTSFWEAESKAKHCDSDNDLYWGLSRALTEAVTLVLPELRQKSGDCPACMLAALRQAKIPVSMAEGFSFTKEMKEIWGGINESKCEGNYY